MILVFYDGCQRVLASEENFRSKEKKYNFSVDGVWPPFVCLLLLPFILFISILRNLFLIVCLNLLTSIIIFHYYNMRMLCFSVGIIENVCFVSIDNFPFEHTFLFVNQTELKPHQSKGVSRLLSPWTGYEAMRTKTI